METFSGDCGFILKSSEKPFSFSLLQFLASEGFVDRLVSLNWSKDFQNFRILEIIFLVNKLEQDWFKKNPFNLNAYLLCLYYQEHQFLNSLDG